MSEPQDPASRSVELSRAATGRYTARNTAGAEIEFGREEGLLSPVELLLVAIAGCSSVDVDTVTSRSAEPTAFRVEAAGRATPSNNSNRWPVAPLVSASRDITVWSRRGLSQNKGCVVGNPSAEKITCPTCGTATRYNKRTGRLYSHQNGVHLEACPTSGDQVRPPEQGPNFPPPNARRIPVPEAKKPKGKSYYDSNDSTSVKTVSAGLPGHGKRR